MSFANPTTGWAAGNPAGRLVKFVGSIRTAIAERQYAQPAGFHLAQNYPNPLWSEVISPSAGNSSTVIQYEIPKPARVKLTIYNVLGEKIRTLVDSNAPVGIKQVTWDGRNERGQRVASGVYLYRLEAGEFTMTRRLLMMK